LIDRFYILLTSFTPQIYCSSYKVYQHELSILPIPSKYIANLSEMHFWKQKKLTPPFDSVLVTRSRLTFLASQEEKKEQSLRARTQ
jgi:hypothetical protein